MDWAAASVSVGAAPRGGVAAANSLAHASAVTRVAQPDSRSATVAKLAIVGVWPLLSGSWMDQPLDANRGLGRAAGAAQRACGQQRGDRLRLLDLEHVSFPRRLSAVATGLPLVVVEGRPSAEPRRPPPFVTGDRGARRRAGRR